ncbi:spore coat protein CotJB [Gracilibacillus caseinilyticus]|uniref:Spore coat protein CotJB n=1 Tax=Gracilibacillus caseinilyticus TaxID=2932256 RepID=A0ABY4ETF3_9BACI|nr:spore coat protein CotJB [Gracilibacillus caseinilyticus]UOQ47554.1 spore coat protein CotJB [Gracilibacillus caseinilyticus]
MTHSRSMPDSYYQQLEQIQAIDFVLVELTLYLDTHPDDVDAINQFNQAAFQSRQLKNKFEEEFGPLMQFGQSYSGYPWNWKDAPWPWQV